MRLITVSHRPSLRPRPNTLAALTLTNETPTQTSSQPDPSWRRRTTERRPRPHPAPRALSQSPSSFGFRSPGGGGGRRPGEGLEGVSSPAGCVLPGLTQLENLASFYRIYHFAIYGHRELLAARPGSRWWAPRVKCATYQPAQNKQTIAHPAGQVGGPREGLYIVLCTFLH